jgi:hypothetical protein
MIRIVDRYGEGIGKNRARLLKGNAVRPSTTLGQFLLRGAQRWQLLAEFIVEAGGPVCFFDLLERGLRTNPVLRLDLSLRQAQQARRL